MTELKIFTQLSRISEEAWDSCFSHEVENYGYLLASEAAAISGFRFFYVTVWHGEQMIAAMPGFLTDYALDTTLQGSPKRLTQWIKRTFPKFLSLKLACLGSPTTEQGSIGFSPQVPAHEKASLVTQILSGFLDYAGQQGAKLCGIKDIAQTAQALWAPALAQFQFAALPGMPTAYLDIDFVDMEGYLATLSYGTRKDMRRKRRAGAQVEINTTTEIEPYLPRLMQLYHETRQRSDWQFEDLPEAFFTGVLSTMPGRSYVVLYQAEGELLAANLMIHDDKRLIDKFFCMDYTKGKKHNLYFLSWFYNIETCLARGFRLYQSGQANYENKLRLGSQLSDNQMFFKHRNPLLQRLLIWLSPYLAADQTKQVAP